MNINGIKIPSKRRRKKPTGKPKGQAGWYELRKSLLTFCASIFVGGATVWMWALSAINAAGSVIDADTISAMAHKDGLIAGFASMLLAIVHFLWLVMKDNTKH